MEQGAGDDLRQELRAARSRMTVPKSNHTQTCGCLNIVPFEDTFPYLCRSTSNVMYIKGQMKSKYNVKPALPDATLL